MRRAFKLALRGRGHVSPNPRVGAVVVAPDGKVLGEGCHSNYGGSHAEVAALTACRGKDTRGAAMIVNLEPCCFYGKTPPCSEAIIQAGIERVVAATVDPDPMVNGNGLAALDAAGIEVVSGVLSEAARYLNRGHFCRHEHGRAWCAVKVAVSIDGRMASPDGSSKWITGPATRRLAHAMRADHDAVLVGGGTVQYDDPELTVRSVRGPNPTRIVLSPHYGLPPGSKLARSAASVRTMLVVADSTEPAGIGSDGVELLRMPDSGDGRIDPEALLRRLPEFGVLSLMVEGGAGVLSSFMQAGVIDEIAVCMAPSVIGRGISPFEQFIPDSWEGRPRYVVRSVRRYDGDVVIIFHREEEKSLQD